MRRLALFGFALGLAVPASAQPVGLAPGDAVMLRFDATGNMAGAPDRARAEWTPLYVAAARYLTGLTPPDAPVPFGAALPAEGLPPPPPVDRGRVRLHFFSIADSHSLLVVENGYDRALVYSARMTRDGAARPTDVCLIMPNQRGFEHWPHPIDQLELDRFHFVDWEPGQPQPCA